jgi:hypothetical protein
MANAGYKTREPAELDVTGEQPSLLKEIIETHLNELAYSTDDLGRILALNDRELWSYYLQDQNQPLFRVIHASESQYPHVLKKPSAKQQ